MFVLMLCRYEKANLNYFRKILSLFNVDCLRVRGR